MCLRACQGATVTVEEVLKSFVGVGSLSRYTQTTLLPRLPDNIQQLLSHGVGYLADGMLRTVDPITIAQPTLELAAPIHASHSFPILTTAFGDIVTHWHSRLYLISARVGRSEERRVGEERGERRRDLT